MAASSQIDGFCHTAHHVNYFHLLIYGHALLRKIAEFHRFADDKTAGSGRNLAE